MAVQPHDVKTGLKILRPLPSPPLPPNTQSVITLQLARALGPTKQGLEAGKKGWEGKKKDNWAFRDSGLYEINRKKCCTRSSKELLMAISGTGGLCTLTHTQLHSQPASQIHTYAEPNNDKFLTFV